MFWVSWATVTLCNEIINLSEKHFRGGGTKSLVACERVSGMQLCSHTKIHVGYENFVLFPFKSMFL